MFDIDYTPDIVSEFILDLLRENLAQPVYEVAIPDPDTVERNESQSIEPYVAVQFGDLQQIGSRNMQSTVNDDYRLPIYIQSVGPTAAIARRIATRVNRVMLGTMVPYGGEIRKRAGGGMFPLIASSGAIEAFQMPASFAAPIQLLEVA